MLVFLKEHPQVILICNYAENHCNKDRDVLSGERIERQVLSATQMNLPWLRIAAPFSFKQSSWVGLFSGNGGEKAGTERKKE